MREILRDSGGEVVVYNESDIATSQIWNALNEQHPEVASIMRWTRQNQRTNGVFQRERYATPDRLLDQIRVAYDAALSDDTISGILELSESLALGWLDVDADEPLEESALNLWAEDVNLDYTFRQLWREIFIASQAYLATYWGRRSYEVRQPDKRGRNPRVSLNVPIGLSVLDPLKVVPVGNLLFGNERLAYVADDVEAAGFDDALAGDNDSDLVVQQLFESRYVASRAERSRLSELGVRKLDSMYLLRDQNVWRFTEVRSTHERFAPVRMKSVFELLDLKHQLKAQDRAHLMAATNFIVLVKKGSDKIPAEQEELLSLANQVRTAATVPVIVGDHRLQVEIITPKMDNTLDGDRYNTLDARLSARLLGIFSIGADTAGADGDDSIKLAKVVAKNLENRRSSIIRQFHRTVFREILRRNNGLSTTDIKLQYHPRRIALDLDPALMNAIMGLRDRGELSRESVLDELGFDQFSEAVKRQMESEEYDDIFVPTNVPYDSPQKTADRFGGQNRDSFVDNDTPSPTED